MYYTQLTTDQNVHYYMHIDKMSSEVDEMAREPKTKLQAMRMSKGLTQGQMADAAEQMELQTYSKKERGLRRVTAQEAVLFARVLGCQVEDIT
jgi:DNA-binding XRE family transcriptional regulator